jgi:hypothetical protein
MSSHRPYYRRARPATQSESVALSDGIQVDFSHAWPLPPGDPVSGARQLFDIRAAAVVRAALALAGIGGDGPPRIWPLIDWTVDTPGFPWHWVPKQPWFNGRDLIEFKWYDAKAATIHIPRVTCLAALAYLDYFADRPCLGLGLRSMVSRAVLASSPGWCGSFGPGVDGTFSLEGAEGNYDLSEMHLVPMAYSYYDELSPAAREHLIRNLLAHGRVHRPRRDDTFTSGSNPNDWNRAGFVSPAGYHVDIGETENHIMMIVTTRYLTNQLLFQRQPLIDYDNRRNGGDDYPSCTSLLISLLRRILNGDFSEYNAKPYQSETRWALLNLCTYAYDHEVRLGARMALDYLSAHMAVSSNDLRRLLPFRRRNESDYNAHTADGFMNVGLLDDDSDGGDPMSPYFALQTGNLRACELPLRNPDVPVQHGLRDSSTDLAIEISSVYRLPPLIHDLFVNDQHRRFFQRLHRTPQDEVGGNRNCDGMEIYASSPSYLITAGGEPASWAINPGIHAVIDGAKEALQLGVAVTTSFMPIVGDRSAMTSSSIEAARNADQLIQFGTFSIETIYTTDWKVFGKVVTTTNVAYLKRVANYGVAPDFACGHQVYLPSWVNQEITVDVNGTHVVPQTAKGFCFVDKSVREERIDLSSVIVGGYYLAIHQESPGGLAVLEAFDCLLDRNRNVEFKSFIAGVNDRNAGLRLVSNSVAHYTTANGNQLEFVIWKDGDGGRGSESGAEVLSIEYADPGCLDAVGNADKKPPQLLNGTIMNAVGEAIVQIGNPLRGSMITLDFSDPAAPRRLDSETKEVEIAGVNSEVWVDFTKSGRPSEGDVCRPFNSIAEAVGFVADGGRVRIVPGASEERGLIGGSKRFTLVAPCGGVTIGSTHGLPAIDPDDREGALSNRAVWVECDWVESVFNPVPFLFGTLGEALDAVADGGVVHIQPGQVGLVNVDRTGRVVNIAPRMGPNLGVIGNRKRCSIVAPIGGVTITRRHLLRDS